MAQRGFELLTPAARQPKAVKGQAKGYMTYVLHLAPASLSGFNVCPMATQGCIASCLNTAGRGGIAKGGMLTHETIASGERTNAIQAARIRKTRFYFEDRAGFMRALVKDIKRAKAQAERAGFNVAIRLNGTSDIRWERIRVHARDVIGPTKNLVPDFHYDNIMAVFPDVPFYDYTKIANRRDLPANYYLTFSLADGNEAKAVEAFDNGLNVAVVFRDEATRDRYMPAGSQGYYTLKGERCDVSAEVIDGDETDLRFLDKRGVIVGLYAKGNAKRDRSGFVRD
jgi:hypothetical protein